MGVSIAVYENSVKALKEALQHPKTDMNRDATIQRFEFVIELAWKTARQVMGTQTTAPKDVEREMARNNFISDPQPWFDAIEVRSLTSHTYSEDQAEKTYLFASDFLKHAEALLNKLKTK